MHLDNSKQFIF